MGPIALPQLSVLSYLRVVISTVCRPESELDRPWSVPNYVPPLRCECFGED